MSRLTVLRAAARLTPHMALHQAKRLLRNRIVPRVSVRYMRWVEADAARLASAIDATRVPADLARFVGHYYAADNAAMDAAARGSFTLLGRQINFGSVDTIDWTHKLPDERDHHLWRMKLTQLEIVHALLAGGDPARQRVAVQLLKRATAAATFASGDAFKLFWAPYGASHRLLAVGSGLALAQHAGLIVPEVVNAVAALLARDAAFLWRNIEFDLRNNHTERNLAALCLFHMAAGPPLEAEKLRLDRAIADLVHATVLPDGMQIERSAMYQGLTCMSLRIFAATPFLSDSTRALARERGAAAEAAWLFLTHEDGEIALFNDAWLDEMPPARAVLSEDARAATALPNAGYSKMVAGTAAVWLDHGEIGPRWNPGHGHADFLAIELDIGGRRLIVDPGTSQYSTGVRRTWERSAASHNGPRYDGIEPVEYSGCFKVGRMAAARPATPTQLAGLPAGSIGGTLDCTAGRVARIVAALPGGGALIADAWSAAKPDGRVDLLIPASWTLSAQSDGVTLEMEGSVARLHAVRGTLALPREARWTRHFMAPEPAWSIAVVPAVLGNSQRSAFMIGGNEADVWPNLLAAVDAALDQLTGVAGHATGVAT